MAEHARGVVVVTGGSAGLGRAISRAFAAAGYDVAVLARGAEGLAATVAEVEQAGRRGLGIPCDVGDHEQVDAAAARVEQELGPVTVWVNNAMGGLFAPFTEVRRRSSSGRPAPPTSARSTAPGPRCGT